MERTICTAGVQLGTEYAHNNRTNSFPEDGTNEQIDIANNQNQHASTPTVNGSPTAYGRWKTMKLAMPYSVLSCNETCNCFNQQKPFTSAFTVQ